MQKASWTLTDERAIKVFIGGGGRGSRQEEESGSRSQSVFIKCENVWWRREDFFPKSQNIATVILPDAALPEHACRWEGCLQPAERGSVSTRPARLQEGTCMVAHVDMCVSVCWG